MDDIKAIAISMVGSGAYDILKNDAKLWIAAYFGQYGHEVAANAAANTDSFLVELAGRIRRLEADHRSAEGLKGQLVEALKDPDVAATRYSAVVAAARTSSRERHSILADLVAARLMADSGSERAVASSFAIEIIPRLAAEHLELLGLIAVIHGIRPSHLLPQLVFRGAHWNEVREQMGPIADAYKDWVMEQVAPYVSLAQWDSHTHHAYAHLAAASCIVYERKVRRELVGVLTPPSPDPDIPVRPLLFARLQTIPEIRWPGWLHHLWKEGLEHAAPTPAGMLIGCAVHDSKTGSETATAWEWSENQRVGADSVIEDAAWDGERLNHRFMERLRKELAMDHRPSGPNSVR